MKNAAGFTLLNRNGLTERTKLIAQKVLVKNSSNKGSGNLIVFKKADLKLENYCIHLKSHF